MNATQHLDTVIIGGGQAGLAVGYHLAKRERSALILDRNQRVGDAWRRRWDSLRVFTPAKFDGLPGMPFPAAHWSYPTKDDLADYLSAYAARFGLSIRTGVQVTRLARNGDGFVILAGDQRYLADQVVIATGSCHVPRIPGFAASLDPGIVQLHSSAYRNPGQLRDGDVLLVGAGNSGAEIAYELSHTHRCLLAGREAGHIPVRHGGVGTRIVFPMVRFMGLHVLNRRNPIGRRIAEKAIDRGDPLVRVRPKDLAAASVERVPRVVGIRGGSPVLQGGRILEVANVIWCTGYRSDYSWIDLPIFDPGGEPRHHRGIVEDAPGLYFVGLAFQYALASEVLPGVGRDAEYVAEHLVAHTGLTRAAAPADT